MLLQSNCYKFLFPRRTVLMIPNSIIIHYLSGNLAVWCMSLGGSVQGTSASVFGRGNKLIFTEVVTSICHICELLCTSENLSFTYRTSKYLLWIWGTFIRCLFLSKQSCGKLIKATAFQVSSHTSRWGSSSATYDWVELRGGNIFAYFGKVFKPSVVNMKVKLAAEFDDHGKKISLLYRMSIEALYIITRLQDTIG